MASERPDGEHPVSGSEMPGGGDVRAAVEWHFGDLVERVSVEHPVSRRELRGALASVEYEGRRREEELRSVGVPVECEMPGAVFHLPRGVWASVEDAGDLDEHAAVAARDVHRRMAETVTCEGCIADSERDLFVLCYSCH